MDPSLKPVLDYILSCGATPPIYGLTASRFSDRAYPVEYPERPDWIAFEFERHEAILGTSWTPGYPMDACATTWPRYAFDPVAQKLHPLEPEHAPVLDISCVAVAMHNMEPISFHVEATEDGKYRFVESWSDTEGIVTSLDELVEQARDVVDDVWVESESGELREYVPSEKADELTEELLEAYREEVADKACDAWRDATGKSD